MFMAARIRATETNKQHIHHPYCKGTYLTFLVMTSYELNLLFAILKPHNLSNYNRSVSSAICWCRPYTMVQFMYINKVDQTGRQPQETIVLSWIWLWCYINSHTVQALDEMMLPVEIMAGAGDTAKLVMVILANVIMYAFLIQDRNTENKISNQYVIKLTNIIISYPPGWDCWPKFMIENCIRKWMQGLLLFCLYIENILLELYYIWL